MGDFVRAKSKAEHDTSSDENEDNDRDSSTTTTTAVASKSINPLNATISERGSNCSVGERQLLCLARAIVRRSKIVVLDEATASVDPTTDVLIQQALKEFVTKTKSTIVAIAHRIDTVAEYDRIIVMENGGIREMGSPADLLSDAESEFYKLWEESHNEK